MISKSIFAAVALLSALSVSSPTRAADYYDGQTDRNSAYTSKQRHVDRNFDEDDARIDERRGAWRGRRHVHRVEARASYASDYLPGYVKEWRARRSAIEAWKSKVETEYGYRYANWRAATDKRVNCEGGMGSIYCTVSARPEPTGWSVGWYRDGNSSDRR